MTSSVRHLGPGISSSITLGTRVKVQQASRARKSKGSKLLCMYASYSSYGMVDILRDVIDELVRHEPVRYGQHIERSPACSALLLYSA